LDDEGALRDKIGRLLVFHYSTTGHFENPQGITGIVVREYATDEVWSFSFARLHSEKGILTEFVQLLQGKKGYALAGWNWGGTVYGIAHVQERLEANGLEPKVLERTAIDIAKVVKAKYGESYVKDPKLKNLAKANRIPLLGFVDGRTEPSLFVKKKFVRLERSTKKKVEILSSVIKRLLDNSLTLTPANIFVLVENHPFGIFLQFEALIVIYSYIATIILSLMTPVVFSLPLEFIYASIAMSSSLLVFNDLLLALRTGDIGRLIQSSWVLLLEIVVLVISLIPALELFPKVVARIDLTSLNLESKIAIALASLAPIFVTIRPFRNVSAVVAGTLKGIWREFRQ
jgi:hypothetical protein